ncbi:MAG: carbohydrate ABC transporter permease [bacterium]
MRIGRNTLRNLRNGLLFISPWAIGYLCFILYPMVASLYYSLTDYDVVTPPFFIGFDNYKEMFFEDNLFWTSLYNTLYYAAFLIPLSLLTGITIAAILNMKVRGMALYRTVFYVPTIVPLVASSLLWVWILNPRLGIVNALLAKMGIQGPGWFADPRWSKPALIFMGMWFVGQPIVIYLAGLQDIPQDLYDAATVDGANGWQRFRNVTIPLLTPVIFFNLVMELIGTFQVFTRLYVINSSGGPLNSTLFYALYLYQNAFQYFKMGYASAMAWVLFIIIMVLTLIVFRTSRRWVYYRGA